MGWMILDKVAHDGVKEERRSASCFGVFLIEFVRF